MSKPCLRRSVLVSTALVAVMVTVGCQSSPWESEFRSSGVTRPASPISDNAPLRVREVPWERIQNTLAKLDAERVASDIHPDEWDQARKDAAKAELLRGLQMSESPANIEILGRSDFRTTNQLGVPTDDPELRKFARSIGATTVVWSSSYLGKADVVRSEPVTEWRSGSWSPRSSDGRSRTFSENSTIWVPIVVQQDERAWMAYFLRDSNAR